ncbi:MAG: ABC transporter ATP-binding protein [Zoogloeaceae bacterium]|jgi:sulfonate transport system ATP-binding protein|nr:ABC transporter ATP-binding protein [Zoogloeaceae bacterium]
MSAEQHQEPLQGLKIGPLSKTYYLKSGPVQALQDICLNIPTGKIVSIVGASGCGKSTLLRIIGGLESEFQGDITLNGQPIRGPGLDRGIVFQEHRLLPWLTVEQNILFGLEHLSREEAKKRTQEQLELVGLSAFARAYPAQLSGGMAQRVAIARALANRPEILLLDEPFGALDALTRIQMQEEVIRIWQVERMTTVLVTHDVDEAIYLGDYIVVMSARPGTIRLILENGIAHPRDRADADFVTLRKRIFREFFAEPPQPFVYTI